MKISRKFFWMTAVVTLTSLILVWWEQFPTALAEARDGNWTSLLSIVAIFLGVLLALSIVYRETRPTAKRPLETEQPSGKKTRMEKK